MHAQQLAIASLEELRGHIQNILLHLFDTSEELLLPFPELRIASELRKIGKEERPALRRFLESIRDYGAEPSDLEDTIRAVAHAFEDLAATILIMKNNVEEAAKRIGVDARAASQAFETRLEAQGIIKKSTEALKFDL